MRFLSLSSFDFSLSQSSLRRGLSARSLFLHARQSAGVTAGVIDWTSRRDVTLIADGNAQVIGASARFETANRNGAKMEFATIGEDSDVQFTTTDADITVTSLSPIEFRGGALEARLEEWTITTAQDVEVENSGHTALYFRDTVVLTDTDDISFETLEADSELGMLLTWSGTVILCTHVNI